MLKVGVLGAGHLGKIHLRLLQQSISIDKQLPSADKRYDKSPAVTLADPGQ